MLKYFTSLFFKITRFSFAVFKFAALAYINPISEWDNRRVTNWKA